MIKVTVVILQELLYGSFLLLKEIKILFNLLIYSVVTCVLLMYDLILAFICLGAAKPDEEDY